MPGFNRSLFLFCILSLFFYSAISQDLKDSRTSSYYTFIYKIDNNQAGELYKNLWNLENSFLTNLHDLYPTDSVYRKSLPVGHFVFVHAAGERLNVELTSVNNVQLKLLKNHRDLMLVLADSNGHEIQDANVLIKHRHIPFDKVMQSYRLSKANPRGILTASYQGHTSFFEIDRRGQTGYFARTGSRIIRSWPVRLVTSPFRYVAGNAKSLLNGGSLYAPRLPYIRTAQRDFTGFVVFNKPVFKPGDTILIKAFITNGKGKPYRKPAVIQLDQSWPDYAQRVLDTLKPYRPGGYSYRFIPSDSFKLPLDKSHTIHLKNKKNRTLVSGSFRYEAYELNSNFFAVRSESPAAKSPVLYLKGNDSNNMPLYDIRYEIIILSAKVKQYYERKIFVRDTLWVHTGKLDPVGETKVSVPDSIFPNASLAYTVEITFLNSENERVVKRQELKFDRQEVPVTITLENDSLRIRAEQNQGVNRVLLETRQATSASRKYVNLPYREKLNEYVTLYQVTHAENDKVMVMDEVSDNLEIFASRTQDSLFIVSENPRKLKFRYFIFRNQRIIYKGYGESLNFKLASGQQAAYSVNVQYIWAGEGRSKEFNIQFNKQKLDIRLEHDPVIYPGQQATFTISVKNAIGEPVEDVDLTALATTKKFNTPNNVVVPNLSRSHKTRRVINDSRIVKTEDKIHRSLDYAYWRKILGLDSISFYRFLFPDGGYYEDRSSTPVTQVAPFVVGYGINSPWVIYIDGQPVYYKNVDTVNPYSFAVKPGVHEIKIRLPFQLITVHHVKVDSAQKLMFSINRFRLPPDASSVEMKPNFTAEEIKQLSRYFTQIKWSSNQKVYIAQGSRYYVRKKSDNYYGNYGLIGPLYPGDISYVEKDGVSQTIAYEPFSSYEFKPGMVKIKDFKIANVLSTAYLGYTDLDHSTLKDSVLTREGTETYFRQSPVSTLNNFRTFPELLQRGPTGRITLDYLGEHVGSFLAAATFIINLSEPDEYYVLPGIATAHLLNEGKYQAIVLLKDHTYLRVDSLIVQRHGISYYDISAHAARKPDSLSLQILKLVEDWSSGRDYILQHRKRELQNVRNAYYKVRTPANLFDHSVSGRVIDDEGNGLPGVSVVLKGTSIGTVTDMQGAYTINCPVDGQLIFSYIGFVTSEHLIKSRSFMDIVMNTDAKQLSEVIVVGYAGITNRKALASASYKSLSGRVAGLMAQPGAADSISIRIRGAISTNGNSEPLVILDGIVVGLSAVDYNQVSAFEILNAENATGLYGSRASNGVILISTKPGATIAYLKEISMSPMVLQATEEVPGNTLRRNFSDYAFWQPTLTTDSNGKATFQATFPDDITGWNAYVLGMGSRRMTGQASSVIQSYKPLVAQVMLPKFLVESDQSTALGKITSYKQDSIQIDRYIKVNNAQAKTDIFQITNSKIDSIALTPLGLDSVSVEYGIAFGKYQDAERRKIPVLRKGTRQLDGQFIALFNDTTFDVSFAGNPVSVNIYAQADLLDALLDEIEYLKKYPYECNEQLASKLKALLVSKKIAAYRGQNFLESRKVLEIIKKLSSGQLDEGGWSWWRSGSAELWITLHIAETLVQARQAGYRVIWDQDNLITYLEENLSSADVASRLNVLYFLAKQGQTLSVQPLIDSVKTSSGTTIHQKLLAERLSQVVGNKPDWKWLNAFRSQTIRGNYYWGEDKLNVLDNSVMNTLIVYEMMRKDPTFSRTKDLAKTEGYLLERRAKNWRNTYESSRIVEHILPDLSQPRTHPAPRLELSDAAASKAITTFPVELTMNTSNFTVHKTGNAPIYFTSYTESWSAAPQQVDKEFVVRTHWDHAPAALQAGKMVTFTIEVEVKYDAEYVMIEIPIPAGCSYESKSQSHTNGEVHREYYEHKTNIYCKNLKKGKYTYSIKLLPRYSGIYTVNPARAECMYFPTLYGREHLKQVSIR